MPSLKTVHPQFLELITSEFITNEFQDILNEFHVKHLLSETYAPKQNAVVERFNKTLKMAVYRYMTQWNLEKLSNSGLQR